MNLLQCLQLTAAGFLFVALVGRMHETGDLYRIRRWVWLRLFHFDPVAARVGPWARSRLRCMGCGVKLTGDEIHYYGLSCERCEARHMREDV